MSRFSDYGTGSLLWVDGLAYCMKTGNDKWQFLEPEKDTFTDSDVGFWVEVEEAVVRPKNSVLDSVKVGGAIGFDHRRAAIRISDEYWAVTGGSSSVTKDHLLRKIIQDVKTIKELS